MRKLVLTEDNEGILDQKPGFFVETRTNAIVREMFQRAKKIGRSPVMRALMNMYRSNIKRNKDFSNKIMEVIEKLQKETDWKEIPGEQ